MRSRIRATKTENAERRRRRPRRTVRLKLTILYGTAFLVCGFGLIAITYVLVSNATNQGPIFVHAPATKLLGGNGAVQGSGGGLIGRPPASALPPGIQAGQGVTVRVAGGGEAFAVKGALHLTPHQVAAQMDNLRTLAAKEHSATMHQLLFKSGIALAVTMLLSILLGWVLAGRVLRPLRQITGATREISATNLHRRLELHGPDDELNELGHTINGLLGRLERSFAAQRRFVANASHELRTPLARQRAVSQVALADPDASTDSLRRAHERVLAAGEQEERLIDALLTLSRGQSGLERTAPVDVAAMAADVLDGRTADVAIREITVRRSLEPCIVSGDAPLLERLVANLIDNALAHNVDGGWVEVGCTTTGERPELRVANGGPHLEADDVARLTEPFVRAGTERVAGDGGLGLGLSIVRAIAEAHGATLELEPGRAGGLVVTVRFATDAEGPGSAAGSSVADGGRARQPVAAAGRPPQVVA
jgi:signal transduction histidine kinase